METQSENWFAEGTFLNSASAKAITPISTLIQLALSMFSVLHDDPNTPYPQYNNIVDNEVFDFIVVGGGTSGCVIANRLSEIYNWNVLLLDAGSDPTFASTVPGFCSFAQRSPITDWNYYSVDDEYSSQLHEKKRLHIMRGKTLGGSSSIDYQIYMKGNRADYESWVMEGNPGWDPDTVAYYYRKSENMTDKEILDGVTGSTHGVGGPMSITRPRWSERTHKYYEAFRDNGHDILEDYNGFQQLGYAPTQFMIYDKVRQSTANTFLKNAACRPNLFILKETFARKILFENNRAVGVEIRLPSGEIITVKANKEVILSSGPINTPQIMMLSGIGPKEHLEEFDIEVLLDSPNVGQNLQDHPAVTVCIVGATNYSSSAHCQDPIHNLDKFPNPIMTGFVALKKSQPFPDYQATILPWPMGGIAFPIMLASYSFEIVETVSRAIIEFGQNSEFLGGVINALNCKSRGKVLLQSNNPEDEPLIYTGFYSNKDDLRRHALYLQDFFTIVNSTYFKNVGGRVANFNIKECAHFEMGSLAYLECYILNIANSIFGPVGTCAMGPDGVVDERLKVRGVDGLRIVDGSIMPKIVSGYVGAAVVMIAEKACDMIKIDNGINVIENNLYVNNDLD